MRSRKGVSSEFSSVEFEDTRKDERKQKYPLHTFPYYYGILFCVFLILLLKFIVILDQKLPIPLKKGDEVSDPYLAISNSVINSAP